jgi:hypothetical protein
MPSRLSLSAFLIAIAYPTLASSSSISVAGFNFAAGEEAFADSVEFISGPRPYPTCILTR